MGLLGDIGIALAQGVGGAALADQEQQNKLALHDEQLKKMLAQQEAIDARQRGLLEMRLNAAGVGGTGTGRTGSGKGGGANQEVFETTARASAGATEDVMNTLRRFNDGSLRKELIGSDPQYADDEIWGKASESYTLLAQQINDKLTRSSADYKDRTTGDQVQNDGNIAQGYLSGTLTQDQANVAASLNNGKAFDPVNGALDGKVGDQRERRLETLQKMVSSLRSSINDTQDDKSKAVINADIAKYQKMLDDIMAGGAGSTQKPKTASGITAPSAAAQRVRDALKK